MKVPFKLMFGKDLDPANIRKRFSGRRKISQAVHSFADGASMETNLPRWSGAYGDDCKDTDEVFEFIKNSGVHMLAEDFSMKSTLMNSGIVQNWENDKTVRTERCYQRNLDNMAVAVVCGEDGGTCGQVNANKGELMRHAKKFTAMASLCYNEICDEDIDKDYMWFRGEHDAVVTAFLNKFKQDFNTVLNAKITTITGVKALTQYNVYEWIVYTDARLSGLNVNVSTWNIVGNSVMMQVFKLTSIYDGNNRGVKMIDGANDGIVGTLLGGRFTLVETDAVGANELLIVAPGTFLFWHDGKIVQSFTDTDCIGSRVTYAFKYGIIVPCNKPCQAYKMEFEAPECASDFDFALGCDPKKKHNTPGGPKGVSI